MPQRLRSLTIPMATRVADSAGTRSGPRPKYLMTLRLSTRPGPVGYVYVRNPFLGGRARRPDGAFAEAYDLYLRGMHHRWRQTETDLREAVGCFERAIGLDPDFAGAHAGLALVGCMLSAYGWLSNEEASKWAEAAALRAVELDEWWG